MKILVSVEMSIEDRVNIENNLVCIITDSLTGHQFGGFTCQFGPAVLEDPSYSVSTDLRDIDNIDVEIIINNQFEYILIVGTD